MRPHLFLYDGGEDCLHSFWNQSPTVYTVTTPTTHAAREVFEKKKLCMNNAVAFYRCIATTSHRSFVSQQGERICHTLVQ